MLQLIRFHLLRTLKPIIIWIGRIHAPYSHKSAAKHFYHILDIMQPGDVILSTTFGALSNFVNPGKYKHAIIYIGEQNGKPMIIEAIGEGVVKRTLVECLAEKDSIAIIRSREIRPHGEEFEAAMLWLEDQVGKPYDYSFEMEGNRRYDNFFCSELCHAFWQKINPGISFVLMKVFGVNTASPTDFYKAAPKKTEILFET